MLARRIFPLFLLLFGTLASARHGEPFDQKTFDRLNADGRPILVAIHADWCTTCKAQEQVLSGLVQRPGFKSLSLLRVDFDSQKGTLKAFHVVQQSTLIVFHGGKEVGRLTGATSAPVIEALLQKAF
jgi:thiol:disulfide interchange protein